MRSIKEIKNLKGRKILVRVDFNVPINGGKILDDFRIKKTIPTISYLQKKGAIIILISHLGDSGVESLLPVANDLKKYFKKVNFIKTPILSYETEKEINNLKSGDIVILENLRRDEGEKKNSPSFARALSRYADIYVNDAFSVCHRPHASVIGITKYLPGYAGFQLIAEIENLSKAFSPKHPFLFILGGAKFATKIPLIKKYLRNTDNIFIGGALANNFFKVKGDEIGQSLSEANAPEVKKLLKNEKLILPIDVCVSENSKSHFCKTSEVKNNEKIVDMGPQTTKLLGEIIKKSKFILWNGPLGLYEDGFDKSTKEIIKIIADSKVDNVIGGGDTVAVISKMNFEDKLGFVSTGGGATLDFLTNGSLPGIKALK